MRIARVLTIVALLAVCVVAWAGFSPSAYAASSLESSSSASDPCASSGSSGGGTTNPWWSAIEQASCSGGDSGSGSAGTPVSGGQSGTAPVVPGTQIPQGYCDPWLGMSRQACDIGTSTVTVLQQLMKALLEQQADSGCTLGTMAICGGGLSSEQLTVYSLMFFIGFIIAVAVLMLNLAKAADGKNVNGLVLVRASGMKVGMFIPLLALAPGIAMAIQSVANEFGNQVIQQAGTTLSDGLTTSLIDTIVGGDILGFALMLLTAPFLVIILLIAVVIGAIGVILEIVISKYMVVVILCALPVAVALSIYPSFRGTAMKAIGAMTGLIFVRPLIGLALWIGTSFIQVDSSAGFFTLAGDMLIILAMMVFVPGLAVMMLTWIMPVGLGADSAAGVRHATRQVKERAQNAARLAQKGIQSSHGGGPSSSSTVNMSPGTSSSSMTTQSASTSSTSSTSTMTATSTASTGAAAGGAGAGAAGGLSALGPVGIAAAAIVGFASKAKEVAQKVGGQMSAKNAQAASQTSQPTVEAQKSAPAPLSQPHPSQDPQLVAQPQPGQNYQSYDGQSPGARRSGQPQESPWARPPQNGV